MKLDFDRAVEVFRKVRQVQEEIRDYCLAPDRPDLSVEDFQRVVSQMYNITIEKYQVSFEGTFLRGMVERYTDRAVVYIKKNMEEDWKRFATVKEICHILIDEQEDWSPQGERTIRNLLAEHQLDTGQVAPNVVQSETFAELCATELLYPYGIRSADLEKFNAGELTIAQIANFHKIPEVLAERALSDWYQQVTTDIWRGVQAALGEAA